MLARATAREKEIAVRLALGASRGRVIGQFLAESVLLAVSGAIAGLCLAQVLSRFLVSSLNSEYNPSFLDLRMDWRVLAFTTGLAAMTCILFGLIPAFRATRITPSLAMKAVGRGLTIPRERFGLRRILVVTQIALSLVLLVGALLFIRSFYNLATVDTGFRADGILIARLDLSRANLSPDQRPHFMHDLLEVVHAVPGVQSVTTANNIPLLGSSWTLDLETNGSGEPHKGSSRFNWVSPGYFSTMGIPLLDGRDFNASDTPASVKVAIVNELFARRFLPKLNPIGQTFRTVAEPAIPRRFTKLSVW
jgi:putative ABC transport system permease protein